jgi:hypothetical protein
MYDTRGAGICRVNEGKKRRIAAKFNGSSPAKTTPRKRTFAVMQDYLKGLNERQREAVETT